MGLDFVAKQQISHKPSRKRYRRGWQICWTGAPNLQDAGNHDGDGDSIAYVNGATAETNGTATETNGSHKQYFGSP